MLELAAERPDATLAEMFAEAGISHTAHGNWMRDDSAYAAAFDALRDGRLDAIESNVLADIARRGTPEMLRALPYPWLLALGNYLAKARRRVERKEVHVSGSVDVTHRYASLTPEEAWAELERRNAAYRRAGLAGAHRPPG
jgi:hypothetical protein